MKIAPEPCAFGCPKENDTNHWDSGTCGTEYCGSWVETRCRVCGWYTITCRCGCSNGQSKITEKRYMANWRKK